MKKQLTITALVLALVLCFSIGVCAHDQGTVTGFNDPNTYTIDSDITAGYTGSNGHLWIGTLSAWKGATQQADGATGAMTFFSNGEALSEDDIIITNGVVGIVLAVGTRNPWGYPAGSVLDTGVVTGGADDVTASVGGRDNTWSIECIVNGWDAWAPDNCGTVAFDLVNYDFATKAEVATGGIEAVKVSRIYDIGSRSFDIVTYYSIDEGVDYAYWYNYFESKTDSKCSTRFCVTNKGDDGGSMFNLGTVEACGSYTKTDDIEYSVGICLPGEVETSVGAVRVGTNKGSVGYKELRIDGVNDDGFDGKYTYTKGEKVTYPLAIVIGDTADFTDINEYYLDYTNATETSVTVSGADADASIVVTKNGKTYGWFITDENGSVTFSVPQDDATYACYEETEGKVSSESIEIENNADTDEITIETGADKEDIYLLVRNSCNKQTIPAKVETFVDNGLDEEGNQTWASAYPAVRFNGDSIYYNEITSTCKGNDYYTAVKIEATPGLNKAVVYGYGYWFYSNPVEVIFDTEDDFYTFKSDIYGEKGAKYIIVDIDIELEQGENWYAGDMHHHANKNDAFSAPSDVVKSIAAAGVDIYVTTDHDFTTNNYEAYGYAQDYNLTGYIPSEEISCSWSHFNVITYDEEGYEYFLDENQNNNIMNQFAELQFFVDQTHSHHAAITVNHPWYSYGLFYSNAIGSVPGGYTDDYDNVEVNSSSSDAEAVATLVSVTDLWTSLCNGKAIYVDENGNDVYTRKAHYLVGGSDTHDVLYPGFADDETYQNTKRSNLDYCSGKIRTYSYVDDMDKNDVEGNGIKFANSVLDGHSYISYGPLMDMADLPGYVYDVDYNGTFTTEVVAESVSSDITGVYVLTSNSDTILNQGSLVEVNANSDTNGTCGNLHSEEELTGLRSNDGLYNQNVDGTYLMYDAAATEASDITYNEDGSVNVTVNVEDLTGHDWVSIVVVDEVGNYAISNPWWIYAGYKDVPDTSWYYEAVRGLSLAHIVQGYGEDTYAPFNCITRAEFAQMCYNMIKFDDIYEVIAEYYNIEAGTQTKTYSDVDADAWYAEAINGLSAYGFLNGYPDGTFAPDAKISRAEIAQVITNIAGALDQEGPVAFSDVDNNDWFYPAVMNLASSGLVRGYPDGTFCPNANADRAEAAQMIYNLLDKAGALYE